MTRVVYTEPTLRESSHRAGCLGDTEMAEPLTPLVYLVPLQLFTYWLALELGRNPDLFRQDEADHRVARAKYQL